MQYRKLGKSGLQISLLSLGSWLTFGKQIEDGVAEALMVKAYESGVNFFDNAEIYARGRSEEVMGRLLKKLGWRRSSYLVSSKVFFGDGNNLPNETGLNRKHVVEACHAALRRLQVDYLDLYFCHRPDANCPIAETVWTMHRLIMEGKILYWGTSEWSAAEIMEAHRIAEQHHLIGPVMEQPQYNLLHRHKVEVEYARIYNNVGLGTTVWSPLASGVLTDKYADRTAGKDTRLEMKGLEWLKQAALTEQNLLKVRALQPIARSIGASTAQLAIAWCARNPNVSSVILGASKPEQLDETLQSLQFLPQLTDEVLQQIEAVVQTKPQMPEF